MFYTFSSNFNSEDIAWLSSLQTLLTDLNFSIAKYFSVICLPYLFQSNPLSLLTQRDERIQQWTNGKKEGGEIIQHWTNYKGATGNYTADGLTAENLIAKDQNADLPEQSNLVKRHQLKCCT